MAIALTKDYRVYVACDLVSMGVDEFGTPYDAESYYVVVERADGKRLAHHYDFCGCVRHEDHEAGYVGFEDVRKDAKAQADILADRIIDAGYINEDHWFEMEASYGSEYYCNLHNF